MYFYKTTLSQFLTRLGAAHLAQLGGAGPQSLGRKVGSSRRQKAERQAYLKATSPTYSLSIGNTD